MAHVTLFRHRKLLRFMDALGVRNRAHAIGYLECLWSYVYQDHSVDADGRLNGWTAEDVAFVASFEADAQAFIDALIKAQFLDVHEDGTYSLHNYELRAPNFVQDRWRKRGNRRPSEPDRARDGPERSSVSEEFRGNARTVRNFPTQDRTGQDREEEGECETHSTGGAGASQPWRVVVDFWNENRGVMPSVRSVGARRLRRLRARWKESPFRESYEEAITKMRDSDFCQGKNDRSQVWDFDMFLDHWDRIIEGRYDNRQKPSTNAFDEELKRVAASYSD